MHKWIAFALTLIFLAPPVPTYGGERIGVVLMHGKSGTSRPKSPIGKLATKLRQTGFLVKAPDMPWSRSRYLSKDYEGSMKEIDNAVSKLRKQGAKKIVVGGHSMGSNAAIGYGATRKGIAGIMVLAPGHIPSADRFQNALKEDYRQARKMVNSGHGSEMAPFRDINQGKRRKAKIRADIYLSWFDKDGPASMPNNTRNLKPGTALLWVVGKKDRMWLAGEGFAFSSAPDHPKNHYAVVSGGHKATPTVAATNIIKWLKGL